MMYSPAVANDHLLRAAHYFGPRIGTSHASDPVNYYVALCNLVANYLFCGNFKEAYETATNCERFANDAREKEGIQFPRRDILANNLTLSRYRFGRSSAEQCASAMHSIERNDAFADASLLDSNWAGFSVLSGKAEECLDTLWYWNDRLLDESDFDPYYTYFIGNNLTSALIAIGEISKARDIFNSLEPLLESIRIPLKAILIPRHRALSRRLQSQIISIDAWDRPVSSSEDASITPHWQHYAHGILLSDLQLWSED